MEEVKGGKDKLALLRDVLARYHSKGHRTLIFCNTVASCRAVEYAINQVSRLEMWKLLYVIIHEFSVCVVLCDSSTQQHVLLLQIRVLI